MAGTIKAQDVFSFLRPDQVNAISDASERVTCNAGDLVYQKGDKAEHLYVVLDGEVTLRVPGQGGVSLVIDQLGKGALLGGPLGQKRRAYALSAQCSQKAKLLKIEMGAMKKLMEQDERMGLYLQRHIATAYFNRYIDTMKKLQAIVRNIPVEA